MNIFKNKFWSRLQLVFILIGFASSQIIAQMFTNGSSLFSDQRARQVGDIVTILIVEYSSASSQASTSSQKDSEHGVSSTGGSGTQAYMPLYGLKGQFQNGYDNEAGTTRQGSLKGKITAQISDITDTGNLIISGSRDFPVAEMHSRIEVQMRV